MVGFASGHTATILNVDDDGPGRFAITQLLQRAGFRVLEAATGGEALRLVAGQPDLVVLDVHLPDMSGLEVCRRIKADPATSFSPVLHLSATSREAGQRAHGLAAGADAYLTEPVRPEEFLANVHALLRLRQITDRFARL